MKIMSETHRRPFALIFPVFLSVLLLFYPAMAQAATKAACLAAANARFKECVGNAAAAATLASAAALANCLKTKPNIYLCAGVAALAFATTFTIGYFACQSVLKGDVATCNKEP